MNFKMVVEENSEACAKKVFLFLIREIEKLQHGRQPSQSLSIAEKTSQI
jgi:hypothetical protein